MIQHAAPATPMQDVSGLLAHRSPAGSARPGPAFETKETGQTRETTGTTAPYGFDLRSPDFIADPYPVYARLRAEAPITFVGRRWVVSQYADVASVLQSSAFGRAGYDEILFRAFGPGPLYESLRRWMLFLDAPDHTRLRGLVMRAFTPRAIERLRSAIRARVDGLLDDFGRQGGGDLIAQVAYPLPVMVICDMLGVPTAGRDQFGAWSDAVGRTLQVGAITPQIVAEGNEAAHHLTEYFQERVAEQRLYPGDNLLSALIAAEDESGRLSEQELLATVMLLFFAGHETTVNLIGNGVLSLLRHPDQWRLLCAQPELSGRAVEEVLRYESPVQLFSRTAEVDTEIRGVKIAAGEVVTGLIGSANRDPERFPNPDRLDIMRPTPHHLAFATGPHYCLGAALARLEAEAAFAALAQRFPELKLASETVHWRQNNLLRGTQSLTVAC